MAFQKYIPKNGDLLMASDNSHVHYLEPNGVAHYIDKYTDFNVDEAINSLVLDNWFFVGTDNNVFAFDLLDGNLETPIFQQISSRTGQISFSKAKGWVCFSSDKGFLVWDYNNRVTVFDGFNGYDSRRRLTYLSEDGTELLAVKDTDVSVAVVYDTSDWSVKEEFTNTCSYKHKIGYIGTDWIVIPTTHDNNDGQVNFIDRLNGNAVTTVDVGMVSSDSNIASYVERIGDKFVFANSELGFYDNNSSKGVDVSSGTPTLISQNMSYIPTDYYRRLSRTSNKGLDSFRMHLDDGYSVVQADVSGPDITFRGRKQQITDSDMSGVKFSCLVESISSNTTGYKVTGNIVESLVVDDFDVVVHDLFGNIISNEIKQAGQFEINVGQYNKPVVVTIRPNVKYQWVKNHMYNVGDMVFPTNTDATPYYYKCVTAGLTGVTEPFWSQTQGAQQIDNNCTWECVEHVINPCSKAPVMPVSV